MNINNAACGSIFRSVRDTHTHTRTHARTSAAADGRGDANAQEAADQRGGGGGGNECCKKRKKTSGLLREQLRADGLVHPCGALLGDAAEACAVVVTRSQKRTSKLLLDPRKKKKPQTNQIQTSGRELKALNIQ